MRRFVFAAWCGGLAVAIIGLHLLADTDLAPPREPGSWGVWAERVGPATAIVGILRLLALGLAW